MAANERSFFLKDDGQIPNNPELQVIIYEGVFTDNPNGIEETFNRNKWTGSWSGGIFDFHHYHSNAHEVLGVKSGNATVLLGGDTGERVNVSAGDVILLPAGTGHKLIEASEDFEVIGAYPEGMSPNMKERDPAGRAQALQEIRNVPLPETDPVYGETGPLQSKWVK
ncbi:cupin domain-containing protein [Bacillus sp. B-jedd]|uniref:cupin domain-containing protein n=1 Tax=Bacillus sp. B-jedd TaxID=1476857 RepID=UPI000515699F|nr:cupin domain-containing protein [Bacillus sp. B-jedd]CEG29314.1 cupin family protein [Bacillus sp. B-jedd]